MVAPRTKRQERAAETGKQLLASARATFGARGYAGTTVGAITKGARTAHGTFYLHFKNKDDAFIRVIRSVLDEMYVRTSPPEAATLRQTVEFAVRGYLEVFAANTDLWRCLLEAMLQNPALEAMWLELRQPFIRRIARAMRRAREAGMTRDGVDFDRAAAALCAMCEWHAFTNLAVKGARGGDDLDTIVAVLSDLWYHAVYRDPA